MQGSLELSGPAPAEGAVVTLASSDTAAAAVDASLTVPSGASTARFPVATRTVATETLVTISASAGGQTKAKTIRLGASAPIIFHNTLNASGSRDNVALYLSTRYENIPFYGNMADDFVSARPGNIRTIRWQGGYCSDSPFALPVQTPAAQQFIVTLFRDDGNRYPGAVVWEGSVTPSQVSEERILDDGSRSACHFVRSAGPSSSVFYEYRLILNTPVPVMAGQLYWLQIAAEMGRSVLKWNWRQGVADNNWSTPVNTNSVYFADMAFELSSVN